MGSRENITAANIRDSHLKAKLFGEPQTQTLAADLTLAAAHPWIQVLDPGGAARNVDLPPEEEGLMFWIINIADAAETITVREDAGVTTICTVAGSAGGTTNQRALIVCARNAAGALTWYAQVGADTA